jgi:hypothetical protein
LLTNRRYVAFWSYTRFDDEHDGQWLTGLRAALQAEVQALSGVSVEIFQDIEGIAWGEQWNAKIKSSADDAVFLIPVITPSYFQSEACRSELEQFIEREQSTGFGELILPVYYIDCPQLENKFKKGADRLARVVASHNYEDLRSYRHRGLDSYEARQAIQKLAKGLIKRLNGLALSHLASKKMEARITAPAPHARVPRRALILGTLREVPEWVEIWLVVAETGARYHPQVHLPSASGAWQSSVVLGGPPTSLNANHEFTIHVLAVTEDVNSDFERYLRDAGKLKNWSGVPVPPDSRVLSTVQLVRDDSISVFDFMEGVYDEYLPNGTATGGMITVKLSGADSFATEAKNQTGKTEWTGSIKMAAFSQEIRGEGAYSYSGKSDFGEHRLTTDAATGDLKIEGKNTSAPGGQPFETVWKKRA